MNSKNQQYAKYIKLLLYIVVIVLVNLAGLTLFLRIDLTANQVYSLSPVSKKVVAKLAKPLIIKVFFSNNLPAPHNNTERYLQDLLNEYELHANKKHFNYHFYNVSDETEGLGEDAGANRNMAHDYGIHPIQIQMVESDEVKFKKAYMGLVMIHDDLVERIPAITTTEGLEYKLTTAIQKLNNKVSALLNLEENVQVKLVLSSSLNEVAPYMGIDQIAQYPDKIKEIIQRLNEKSYNRLTFTHLDPTKDQAVAKEMENYQLMQLKWPAIDKAGIQPGQGIIGMLVQYKQEAREIPLLNVVRLPIFGTQYQLAKMEEIEQAINTSLERLVQINTDLGFLADHGTLNLYSFNPMGPGNQDSLRHFNTMTAKTYSLKTIKLKEQTVPAGLQSIVIARPTEKFSDYALYQIDQALMRGTNLAIFTDAFKEIKPQGQQQFMPNQMPNYVPMDSGLEKLLAHYGVRTKQSLVLDEKCYRQRLPRNQGGGERPIYFAPIIQNENMNKDLNFMKNIKGLIALKISPLELDQKRIEEQKLTAHQLFASSSKSWQMRDRINLNPMFITPPAAETQKSSQPLAYMLEGSFTSYFKGKPMPEKPAEEKPEEKPGEKPAQDSGQELNQTDKADEQSAKADLSQISGEGTFRGQSPLSKIMVVASSELIKDSLVDEQGQSSNAVFVMNMIDALNNREAIAAMRSKNQRFNPLAETGAATKLVVKVFNIGGLPIIVVLFGLIVWMRRHARQRKIQLLFQT